MMLKLYQLIKVNMLNYVVFVILNLLLWILIVIVLLKFVINVLMIMFIFLILKDALDVIKNMLLKNNFFLLVVDIYVFILGNFFF
jgi:hypothetical protein